MASCEQSAELKRELSEASAALYCFLNMLAQMDADATVDAAGLRLLLLPVSFRINWASEMV